jgi:hypothetical protein
MIRMIESETMTAVLIAGVLLLSVGMAGATAGSTDTADQPQPPMALYGQATIDGDPLPAGTTIVAEIDGEVRGSITIEEAGRYGGSRVFEKKLSVSGTSDDEGRTVRFYADGIQANETVPWSSASLTQLNLSFVTSDTTCVNRAVAGPDGEISLSEIQTAINWWAEDTEVPDTGGRTISLRKIQSLINAWAEDQPVSCQG